MSVAVTVVAMHRIQYLDAYVFASVLCMFVAYCHSSSAVLAPWRCGCPRHPPCLRPRTPLDVRGSQDVSSHTHRSTHKHTHTQAHKHTYTHTNKHTRTSRIHTSPHTGIHTHKHTQAHIHKHTHPSPPPAGVCTQASKLAPCSCVALPASCLLPACAGLLCRMEWECFVFVCGCHHERACMCVCACVCVCLHHIIKYSHTGFLQCIHVPTYVCRLQ
jgi:hypothetical protein